MPAPNPTFGIINGGSLTAGFRGVPTSLDTGVATYRAALTAQTFYSTAAAVVLELQGSATKTIRVKHIGIAIQAATKFFTELTLLRCTGLSGGTPNPVSMYPLDVNDAAASAVCNNYTAAATQGAGHLVLDYLSLPTAVPSATIISPSMSFFTFGKAFVLRGTGDVLQLYNNVTGFGAGTYGFVIEWEEDNS